MDLTPVESSHIAAIGYLEADRVLLVRYKDGALYALPGWNSVAFDQLMRAESKGKALAACTGPRIKIPRNAADLNDQRAHMQDAESVPQKKLNVLDPDSGKCCRKLFLNQGDNVDDKQEFTCSDCGTLLRAEMQGVNRYWAIVPLFAVHRVMR